MISYSGLKGAAANDVLQCPVKREKLYTELYAQLTPFCLRLTRDKEEAGDLLQESLCKMVNHFSKATFKDSGASLKSYTHYVVKNAFLDSLRKKAKEGVSVELDNDVIPLDHASPLAYDDTSFDYLADIKQELKEKFSGRNYQLWELHNSGYKYKELAKKFDMPIGTVKGSINRVREAMKDHIRKHNDRFSLNLYKGL